jgi:alpha-ketoglutarate-dependent taurine dioxygenase
MAETQTVKNISSAPGTLTIEWSDGAVSEYPSVWLRDNRAQDRDSHSGQRLVDVLDLPEQPRIRAAIREPSGIRIDFEDEALPASFSFDWLASNAPGRLRRRTEFRVRPWLQAASLDPHRDFAWQSLAALRDDRGTRLAWLTRLVQEGLAFIADVPAEEGALLEAMPLVGRVLETNYGLTFDVRSVPQPENLAYSDLGLGLHTDNPYREPVPGFQALHALVPSSEGGESLFSDGFALAGHLRETAPEAFSVLTSTPVPFLYRSKDAELYAERPLIQLSPRGEVAAIHYNSRSIAPISLPSAEIDRFYSAYRAFAALLRDPRFQLRTHLGSGVLVVFDNQRVLHGRTAFSAARFGRHLKGCYLSRDSVFSEAALLRRVLAETL